MGQMEKSLLVNSTINNLHINLKNQKPISVGDVGTV